MFEKKDDGWPRYRVELPIVTLPAVETFVEKYNIPQVQLTVGYLDYSREIGKDDLRTWMQNGDISSLSPELELWMDDKLEFEKVDVLCYEWYYE